MMGGRAVLCLDEVTCCNPGLIGLEGEPLDSLDWLEVHTKGAEARRAITSNEGRSEVWVVSCDDVEPINLAATIKEDQPEARVCLVASELCGSLMSRAHTAEIDEVIDYDAFRLRYAQVKQRFSSGRGVVGSGVDAPSADSAQSEQGEGDEAPAGNALKADAAAAGSVLLEPAVELIETPATFTSLHLPSAQAQPMRMAPTAEGRAFVLTVVSGSGGAGKSSVSALGAVIAERMGYRTLLLDCDLQFGDVAALVGVDDPLRIDEMFLHPERIDADLAQAKGLSVLAAPLRLEFSEEVIRSLPGLLEHLVGMFDVIVVNTGASWAEQHAILLERSSASLFLVDQRASSVRACRHALELCARCGIATNPFHFALNRCAKGSPLTSIDVSCALQGVPVLELKDGGREVEDYLSGGAAVELVEMRNEFARSIEQVLVRLLPTGNQRLDGRADDKATRRITRRRGSKGTRKRGRGQR